MTDRQRVKDASDSKQVARGHEKDDDEAALLHADLKAIMESNTGRRFIWRILQSSKYFQCDFSDNALHNAYDAGTRAVGGALRAEVMGASMELYQLMEREAMETERQG